MFLATYHVVLMTAGLIWVVAAAWVWKKSLPAHVTVTLVGVGLLVVESTALLILAFDEKFRGIFREGYQAIIKLLTLLI